MHIGNHAPDIEIVEKELDKERRLQDEEAKDPQMLLTELTPTAMVSNNVDTDSSGVDIEEFTPEEYRRLLRKIDFIVLPAMWLCVSARSVTYDNY